MYTMPEHREVLKSLHHMMEILSFAEYVSASVSSHLLGALKDVTDGRVADLPSIVEESSGFLLSLGSSFRTVFGILATTMATAQLRSREVLLRELGANIPVDVVDRLMYSEPVLDAIFTDDSIAEAKTVVDVLDTRALVLRAASQGSASAFRRPSAPAPAFKRPFLGPKAGSGGGGRAFKKKRGTGGVFNARGRGGKPGAGSGASK